jgi:hypothetical protein
MVFEKKRRKLAKIAENCDHNIDPKRRASMNKIAHDGKAFKCQNM